MTVTEVQARAGEFRAGTRVAFLDRSPAGPDKVMVRIGVVSGEPAPDQDRDDVVIPVAPVDAPEPAQARPVALADVIGHLPTPDEPNRHRSDRNPPVLLRGLAHAGKHRRVDDVA